MLGLLLIYFIWKYYSELAFEYHRSRWGYAILGIASYYAGTAMGGIILYAGCALAGSDFPEETARPLVSLICMPFGILAVWGLYKLLEKNWARTGRNTDNDSLDADLIKSSDQSQNSK